MRRDQRIARRINVRGTALEKREPERSVTLCEITNCHVTCIVCE
jgi:hypothetical protein